MNKHESKNSNRKPSDAERKQKMDEALKLFEKLYNAAPESTPTDSVHTGGSAND